MSLEAFLRMGHLPVLRAKDFELSEEPAETVIKRGLSTTLVRTKRVKRKKRNKQARKSRTFNSMRR